MKKKCGFTIPEMLAVIVILGILITISSSAYNGISKRLKENSLTNKVAYYKEKALEYAEDNDIVNKTISLSSLIDLGYVDAEHPENPEQEKIDNPVTNDFLDCMNFTISRDMDDYNITYDLNGSCELLDEEKLEQNVTIERFIKSDDSLESISDDWVNEQVYLLVKVKNISKYSLKDNKINFNVGGSIESGLGSRYCDTIYNLTNPEKECLNVKLINTNYIFNNNVYVNLELLENVNNTTKSYKISKTTNVKIDMESPKVTAEYNSALTTGSVKVTLSATDGNGSGIYGYYISKDDLPAGSTKYDFVSPTENYISQNDKYYIYAVDNTGNISEKQEIIINNIDRTGPTEFISYPNRTSWTRDDLTVSFGCKTDSKAGCKNELTYSIIDTSNGRNKVLVNNKTVNTTSVSYTFHVEDMQINARGNDESKKSDEQKAKEKAENEVVNNNYISTARVIFTIKDNLGNTVEKKYDINVKIDKVNPIVVLRAGDRTKKKKWLGLATAGYYYNMYITVTNAKKIPSGINTSKAGFSTSQTDVKKLQDNPFGNWDKYFSDNITKDNSDRQHLNIYVAKSDIKYFTFREVSKTGVATYGASLATDKDCKEYLASAAAGGAAGLGIGAFALMLFGGPVGWVLAGATAAGVAAGALLCANN